MFMVSLTMPSACCAPAVSRIFRRLLNKKNTLKHVRDYDHLNKMENATRKRLIRESYSKKEQKTMTNKRAECGAPVRVSGLT